MPDVADLSRIVLHAHAAGWAVWRTLSQLSTAGAAVELCWELIGQGGVRVQTPPAPARPVIVTTVQLDGDIITLVDPALLEWQSDALTTVRRQHMAAVRDALAPLSLMPGVLRAALALPFGVITAANCGFFIATAWPALIKMAGAMLLQIALAVLWRAIVPILVRVFALLLRWRLRSRFAEWRAETARSGAALRARSAARRAAHAASGMP